MLSKFLKIRVYKIFILFYIIYSVILIFELNILYSKSNFVDSFKEIYDLNEIIKIIESHKTNEWLNFLVVPFYILGISFSTALILFIFKFLHEINISFNNLFKISVQSHIIYLLFYFLNVLIRTITTFNIIYGEVNYFSLINYLDGDLSLIIINLLNVFDLRLVLYIFCLSFIIEKQCKIKFKKSILFVFSSILISVIFYALIISIFNMLIV